MSSKPKIIYIYYKTLTPDISQSQIPIPSLWDTYYGSKDKNIQSKMKENKILFQYQMELPKRLALSILCQDTFQPLIKIK